MADDPTQIMVPDSAKVWLALYGGTYTLPTNPTSTPVGFTDLGLLAEEQVQVSLAQTVTEVRAFGIVAPVRRKVRARAISAVVALLQQNTYNLKAAWGGGAVTVTSGVAKFTPPSDRNVQEFAVVIDQADGTLFTRRTVIPRAAVLAENLDLSIPDGQEQITRLSIEGLGGVAGVELCYFYEDNDTALSAG